MNNDMTMNLVLQGVGDCAARLQRIAALTAPKNVVTISDNAVRCEGISFTPALRQTIEIAAQAAQLDATYMMGVRRLDEFDARYVTAAVASFPEVPSAIAGL